MEEAIWHVWGESPQVPQKLGRLTFNHLERKELADSLLSRGGQPPQERGPQRGAGVLFGWSGDDVL
jgi:hypothetical protein